MNKTMKIIFLGMGILALTSCGGNSGNNGNAYHGSQDNPTPNLDSVFSSSANDEPSPFNADELERELNSVFGDANSSPVAVLAEDTIEQIRQRAQAN